MPVISSGTRLIIWILTGVASFLFVLLLAILQPNINYLIQKVGRVPSKKPIWLWVLFWSSATVMITGTAIGSSVPELPATSNEQPIANQSTPSPTPPPTHTFSPTIEPPNDITLLSDYYLDKKLDLAVLFSVEDYKRKPTLETKINLFNTVQKSRGVVAFFRENSFAVRDIEFNSDGSLFATSGCSKVNERGHCIQGEILVWEVSDSSIRMISRIMAHHNLVYTLIFSPDNKTLISGSCREENDLGNCILGELKAWDISNPQNPIQAGSSVDAHAGFVYDLVFITDTNILLSSGCGQDSSEGDCIEGQVLSWKIANNGVRQEKFSISLQTGAVKSIAISHNRSLLVTGTEDGFISLWRIADINSVPQLLNEFKSEFNAAPKLIFSPDDKMLFSANSDDAIKFWDIQTDYSIVGGQSFYSAETSISFDPINNLFLAGGTDKTIKVWDYSIKDHPELIAEPYTAHNSEIYVIKAAPNGRLWISGAKDGSVIVWDFLNQDINSLLAYPLFGHSSDVLALSISSDEKIMASGSCAKRNTKGACNLGEIILWDITNPVTVRPIGQKFFGHTEHVYSLAFSPSNKIFASGGGDGNIILWDITNPEVPIQIGLPLGAHKRVVQSLAFTPDGKILASGGDDGKLILWDISNSQKPKVMENFFTGDRRVYDIEFSSNDFGFVAADGLQKLMLSDASSISKIIDSERNIRSIAINPTLNILATAGSNSVVYLWNTTNLNSPLKYDRTLVEQNETILDISFGKNHNVLASGSADATIGIWYLEDPSGSMQPKPIAFYFLRGHVQNVLKLKFLSDDNFLVSSGGDDKILVWNLDPNFWIEAACRIITHNFTADEWKKYFPNDSYRFTC